MRLCVFLFFLSTLVSNFINAQNDLSIDDFVFVCEDQIDNVETSLLSGTSAFLLELKESNNKFLITNSKQKTDLKSFCDHVKPFLKKDDQALISLIFKGSFEKDKLQRFLKDNFSEKVAIRANEAWPKINDLKEKGIQIFVVFESDVVRSSITQVRTENKYSKRFSSDPLHKLVQFNSNIALDTVLYNHTIEFWKTTGKAPNFVVAPKVKKNGLIAIADSLNSKRRFRGVIKYKGDLLNEISWTDSSEVITPAKFSFPLTEFEMILSPYKTGYRITPAEVIHHRAQSDAPREFSAYDVAIKDKLIYDFSFEGNALNAVDTAWDRAIFKDVSFVKDAERGSVLYFNSNDAFIDYSKENTFDFKTPISVSVWVKPEKIEQYMGVIGFGMAFSFKLREGSPDFTMATVKDHVVEKPLKVDTWQHLVVVYNPKSTVDFYLDGEKIGEAETHQIIPSKQSLVIGNNIWGEQFYGAIDDLKIWDRGLSEKEIKELFLNVKPSTSSTSFYLYLLVGGIIFIGIGRYFILRRKKSTGKERDKQITTESLKPISLKHDDTNGLSLFGNFQVNLTSKVSDKPSFSPLHKQLLSYLILSVIDEKDGVTTNKLTDTFWPGVSKLKAKENRNGNIRKLRKVLSQMEGLQVVFENKKWYVVASHNFEIDIYRYKKLKESIALRLDQDKLFEAELEAFLELLKKGNILQNIHVEWVDFYKNKISNEIENLLSKVYRSHKEKLPAELNIKIAKTILLFDNLNEDALKILILEFISSGKHGLAKNAYLAFSKNYEALYAEPFSPDYQSFVKQ